MRHFNEIYEIAATRKGGRDALEAMLAETAPRPRDEVAALPDDRVLAEMTRRIFYAGFSSRVIDAKWEAFEAAFDRFNPAACAFIVEERFDALTRDPSIVRNGAKIRSIMINAQLVLDLAQEHGTAARCFAEWPDEDFVGLLDLLKKRGSHLGGETGNRFLRALGRPAFVTSADVVAALIREDVLQRPPAGKRDREAIQRAFNRWSEESGRDLTAISRVLAMSIDASARTPARGYP